MKAGLLFSILLGFSSLAIPAQSGSFTVDQRGHQVGTADFHIASAASGFDSSSVVQVHMQGLDYALSKTEQLDSARHIRREQVSAAVNGTAVRLDGNPDTSGFVLNTSANGRASTSHLAPHPAAVFLPDFDPGALQNLLMLNVARNGGGIWAIIPRQSGSVSAVQIATLPDEHGTLDGKPVAVHHFEVAINRATTELFASLDDQLLQAELPQQGFALVHKGFVLTPPKKPLAPLNQPARQPSSTQQPQQPRQQ